MKNNIFKNIKENIPKRSTVILAFSGGPDSVYLFNQLEKAQTQYPFKLILAHFNHQLRGKDSELDEKFCISFAKKHDVAIEIGTKNIKKIKGNTEDIARKYRYEFLNSIAKKHKAKFILTAHHLDDNIETFLINFLRGTGLKGLTCMQFKSNNIFRPLLEISKEEILEYLQKNSIKYRIDKSNFDDSYTRNNIRKNIVPNLKKLQPSLNNIFLRNWEVLSETQDFLDTKATNWISKEFKKNKIISLKNFNSLEKFFQKLILKTLYNNYHKTIENISNSTIQRAQKMINEEKTGKKCPFGYKTEIIINSNSFEIINKSRNRSIKRKKISIPGNTKFEYGEISIKIIKKTPKNLKKSIYLDYSKCKKPLYIRGKQDGDVFKNIGMKGTQKLQDFFVNKKISSQKRNLIPIITDKNDAILCVGNISVADTHKITKQTKEILNISFKPSLENNKK